ncbi:rod shape-determining protein MreC [Verrucomicrobiales bacterium]|jgi:rod shape-determining protein MreC|nr:rod shape-determining protein MreC [Verrucomicrobiales bacterium]
MSRLNIILLIVFVAALITITLSSPQTVARIQNGAMTVFSPFMRASNQLESGVETVGTESLSPAQLREMVDELERERNRLKLEVIQLDEIVRENNQLRRALQYVNKAPLSLVAARVISRKPSTWYNTMIINKGKAHGIEVDNPVIVPVGEDAGLVGKVSEVVGDNSAIILLLTDEMCQVSAKLQNSQEQGILNGQRGALRTMPNLRLRYLSREAEVAPGRKVVSSGVGGLFPPDLVLGEVFSVEIGALDAEVTVNPSVNFEELIDIFVVLPVRDPENEADMQSESGNEDPVAVEKPALTAP